MKFILIKPALFLFLLYFFALPSFMHAESSIPLQAINISFDLNKGRMQGNSVITLPPNIPLQLYLGNLEYKEATITQDNKQKPLDINGKKTISLSVAPKQRTVSLSWQLTAEGQGYDSGNLISKNGITLTGFWHPAAERDMLFSLTAELPKVFDGVTEADELLIREKDSKKLLTANYPHPLQSINFVAGPYTVRSRKAGTTEVYSYFFQEDAGLAADYLENAVTYIKHYEQLIGPFPFKRYSIVENRLPTGYGMPGFTLLGQAVVRLPFIKDTSLGHEILHSWFGNALRNDTSGNWCEGLTTYLADQTYAADKGEGSQYRKNQIIGYQAYVHNDNITTLIDFQHGGDSQPMAKKMRAIGYNKSSMVFHMLRRKVGDDQFFSALRRLYKDYKYQQIGWTDIETVFSESTGTDLSLFFGQWLLRNDIPNLSAEEIKVEQKEGRSEISFRLIQHNEAPYRLEVPIVVKTMKRMTKKIIKVDTQGQQFSFTVDNLPMELLLDPEYHLMRKLQTAELHPSWKQFMGAEQKFVVEPDKNDIETYLPIMSDLEALGCKLVSASDLKNSELGKGNFVFLGSSAHTMGLFGTPDHPTKGFTLDVRKNPLNHEHVMVLVSSSSPEETGRVIRKLSHYGKYSYLHFKDGRIQEKHTTPSANGIKYTLLSSPVGIPVQQTKSFRDIVEDILQSRVVYVGETHTDYGTHLLQLQVIQALYDKEPNLVIGMEMFPRSSQQTLDDYIEGKITDEREFIKRSGYFKVWGFDYQLYRDIIGYAKKQQIPIVGLNLEKEIVSTVFKKGATDELTAEQLTQVAEERDLELPGYRQRLTNIHSMHNTSSDTSSFGGFLQAQAMWDETMAESIVNYLKAYPDKRMVVIAGTGHVYKDSAIPPRVNRRLSVRQSVLVANNGMNNGLEKGKQIDYLIFTEPIDIAPTGKIGVVLEEIQKTDEDPGRIKIIRISPHGKAGIGGLKVNDIILAVNSYKITSVGDLKAGLMGKVPGDTVILNILRQDKYMDIEVELSDMDKPGMMMPPGHPKK